MQQQQPHPCPGLVATRHRLVQRRKAAGLSQTAFAERLGITQSEVSKFERGERWLHEDRLLAWMRALDQQRACEAGVVHTLRSV